MEEQSPKKPKAPDQLTEGDFRQLVARANAGKPKARRRLRDVLDHREDIWGAVGDLAGHAERKLIAAVAGNDQLARDSVRRNVDAMRQALLGQAPSTLERMLVEAVLAASLQLQVVDLELAGSVDKAPARLNCLLKWQKQAADRLAAAVASLAELPHGAGASPEAPPQVKVFHTDRRTAAGTA